MARRVLLLFLLLTLALAGSAQAKLLYVGDRGVAPVGRVACPAGSACTLQAPKRVKARIGQRTYWAKVLAPKRIAAGKKGTVRVKLGAAALAGLAGRTTTVKVPATVRRDGQRLRISLKSRLRRAALTPGAVESPASSPVSGEPPLLARPLTAVDVSVAQIRWYPRDSWVRYSFSGSGMSFGGGASGVSSLRSPCPDKPLDEERPYAVDYVAAPSWYDPVSKRAGIYGTGSVRFSYAEHGIDLSAANPEVEIDGAASRAIFRMSGSGSTPYPNQRVALVSLELGANPAISEDGKTFTYSLMRSRLTPDGVNVFAGFYTPPDNDQFGCVSVSFTTP